MTLAMTMWLSFECLSLLLQADSGSSSGQKHTHKEEEVCAQQKAASTFSNSSCIPVANVPLNTASLTTKLRLWGNVGRHSQGLAYGRPDYTIDTSSELLTDRDYWKLVIGEPITGQ